MAVVQVHEKYRWKWYEKYYFFSIASGMVITLKHFIKTGIFNKSVTIRYPEEVRPLSNRFRGLHTLKRDEEGRERCTACFCCQWACPADAIYIEAAEVPEERAHLHPEDKYAKTFQVDLLRCIYCGLCEEACPKGAIYLDGGIPMPADHRDKFIRSKDDMLMKEGGPLIGERK